MHFRAAPLLFTAISFACGILLARWWQPAASLVAMCVLLAVISAAALWKARRLALPAAAVLWVGLGWTCAELQPRLLPEASFQQYADGLSRDVEGRVTRIRELPLQTTASADTATSWDERNDADGADPAATQAYSVDVAVDRMEEVTPEIARMIPASGGVRVTLYRAADQAAPQIVCGDTVHLLLRLRLPQRFRDPGVWQYPDYLAGEGIAAQSSAKLSSLVLVGSVAEGATRPLPCRVQQAQAWAAGHMLQMSEWQGLRKLPRWLRLSFGDAGILNAMLVGDRSRLSRGLRTQFERTGSFHLFVVAGFHVALLAAMVYFILLRLRLPDWLATFIALLLTAGFAILTGFGAPVQRALFMTAVVLFARLLSRESSALNALGAAALAMLVLRPEALFEAGFQMTLLVIVAIGGIAIPLCERTLAPYARATRRLPIVALDAHLPPRLAQFRVSLRMLGEALASHFGAHARTAPALVTRALLWWCELTLIALVTESVMALPMAVYFHRLTPFALPANLLATPVIGLLLGSAIVTFLASLVHPILGLLPSMLTAFLLHAVTAIIGGLSRLHGADLRMPSPSLMAILGAGACWCAGVWAVRREDRRSGALALALLPVAFALLLWPVRPSLHEGSLEFTAIDVGQGDSLLVGSPEGGTMLIDAGGPTGSAMAAVNTGFDLGEEVVSPYLWSRHLRRIDVLVLTHAHSDHIGGMGAVLRNFRPRELWLSVDTKAPALRSLLADAASLGVAVRRLHAGEEIAWSGTSIQVLSPHSSYHPRAEPTNDDSLVLRLAYGKASVLAEGDAERPSEMAMLADGLAPVTLLKVGHHGSRTSTMPELLRTLRPEAAVISCGRGNRFGHPREEVLDRLQDGHTRTWRTDTMGAVQFLLKSDGRLETRVVASDEAP